MTSQKADHDPAGYGNGFARLRDLLGPDTFAEWFASRNLIHPTGGTITLPGNAPALRRHVATGAPGLAGD